MYRAGSTDIEDDERPRDTGSDVRESGTATDDVAVDHPSRYRVRADVVATDCVPGDSCRPTADSVPGDDVAGTDSPESGSADVGLADEIATVADAADCVSGSDMPSGRVPGDGVADAGTSEGSNVDDSTPGDTAIIAAAPDWAPGNGTPTGRVPGDGVAGGGATDDAAGGCGASVGVAGAGVPGEDVAGGGGDVAEDDVVPCGADEVVVDDCAVCRTGSLR